MGLNLRFRAIVVILLTLVSGWILVKPILDGKPVLTLGLDIRGGVTLRYEFAEG